MNYLKFVQYSAENLQFYLWVVDYEKRWKMLPKSKQELSPEWEPTVCPSGRNTACSSPALKSPLAEAIWNAAPSIDFDSKSSQLIRNPSKAFFPSGNIVADNPFHTPASSQSSLKASGSAVSVDTLPWSTPGPRSPMFAADDKWGSCKSRFSFPISYICFNNLN